MVERPPPAKNWEGEEEKEESLLTIGQPPYCDMYFIIILIRSTGYFMLK
jgi:hypothetical protein